MTAEAVAEVSVDCADKIVYSFTVGRDDDPKFLWNVYESGFIEVIETWFAGSYENGRFETRSRIYKGKDALNQLKLRRRWLANEIAFRFKHKQSITQHALDWKILEKIISSLTHQTEI